MNVQKMFEESYVFSDKASTNVRTLSLAGIALVWIFKTGDSSLFSIPNTLYMPCSAFILTLLIDYAQYFIAFGFYDTLALYHEWKKHVEFKVPHIMPSILRLCFYAKGALLIYGYIILLQYAKSKTFHPECSAQQAPSTLIGLRPTR
jgi:hypothetical protein